MKSRLIVLVVWLIVLTVSVTTFTSCGNDFALDMDIWDEPWGNDVYLTDGDRRGEYIYYHGSWHYRGSGTPYYWYH